MNSQNMEVLSFLKQHGSIETIQAIFSLNIFRLAARIYDLRSMGYEIETVKKVSSTGKRYAQYIYRGERLQGGKS